MAGSEAERSVDCPRCGYDLRGEVPTWAAQCPLSGRCPECGLDFAWSELLSAKVRRPSWCVEYAPRVRTVPWRCVKTFAVTLRPWRFWRSLRMHDEPRWRLVAVYLLSLTLPLYGLFCAGNGFKAWRYWSQLPRWVSAPLPSPVTVVAQAVLSPTSNASPGTITIRRGGRTMTTLYPPASSVLGPPRMVLPPRGIVACLVMFMALCPVGFLALPISCRQAKVRTRNLVRITLYSLAFLALVFAVSIVEAAFDRVPVEAVLLLIPAVTLVWWSVATGEHLRMRHGWGVGLAVVTMSLLVTLICATTWVILACP